MNGKRKCKMLKEIRKQIAKENDITYITTECKHQGNCKGTCPKCESEVRYLEAELEKRRKAGKTVAVAGIAAAMMLNASACTTENATSHETESTQTSSDASTYTEYINGEVVLPESSEESVPVPGEEVPEESESFTMGVEPEESIEQDMGDVPPEESEWETTGEEDYDPEESWDEVVTGQVPVDEESEDVLMGDPVDEASYED